MPTDMRSLFISALFLARCVVASAVDLQVSPAGNDSASGTIAKPLATLTGARNAIRRLKQAAPLTEAVTVHVAAGTYFVDHAVDFTAEDSGTATAPITYHAERGSTVRLNGGREVGVWKPVTDPAVLKRLPEEAREHVRVSDLRGQGITNFGQLAVRGFSAGSPPAEAELFFDDAPMTLARWPNSGFRGAKSKEDDLTVIVDTDRVARWTGESAPWIFAYWHYDWAEIYEPLAGVDARKHALLRTPGVKPVYGITPESVRWYALNLLSELDVPGEYYLDRGHGLLYFWPPHPGGRAVLSKADGLIRARELSHVTFRGFTLEACRGTAVAIEGGEDCHVVGCVIRDIGLSGVQVDGGTRHEVYGCDVYDTGEGGISMTGGVRPTLTPGGHNAENNHVHHYSRRARTYKPAISIGGVGNRIAHNLVHDGPHMALSAGGNNHVVEFNEIHNVVEESGDAGAYYVGRDWTQRGTVLRYNYWHDIHGSSSYGGMTLYLDDQHSGTSIYGNLFVRCMQSVFIGGGDDNIVTNNVFLDCWKSAHLDDRGMGWQKEATDDPKDTLRASLRAMPYTNALWSARYPALVHILKDDPGVPKRNVFAGNISAGGQWEDVAPSIRSLQTVTNNLVFDTDKDWAQLETSASGRPVGLKFKDPAAVRAIGFVPLPLEKMGLYPDDRRASWPVQDTVRPVHLPQDKTRLKQSDRP
jgi:hypothetical protein